jgi:hypothetical protein
MKKYLKIASLILASVLYCLLIFIVSCNNCRFDSSRDRGVEEVFSFLSESFSPIAISNEDSIHEFSHSVSLFPKFHFCSSSAFSGTAEILLEGWFSMYNFYAKNVILRPQPTDFIFPHHYF